MRILSLLLLLSSLALADVTAALARLATYPDPPRDVELGGADVITYREMMRRFAILQGRRPPLIVPVPVLIEQIDRLTSIATLANVRLGVIPLDAPVTMAPLSAFVLFEMPEQIIVTVELLTDEIEIIDPENLNWFDWMTDTPDWEAYGRGAIPIQVAMEIDLGDQLYRVEALRFQITPDPWGTPETPGLVTGTINRFANGTRASWLPMTQRSSAPMFAAASTTIEATAS